MSQLLAGEMIDLHFPALHTHNYPAGHTEGGRGASDRRCHY